MLMVLYSLGGFDSWSTLRYLFASKLSYKALASYFSISALCSNASYSPGKALKIGEGKGKHFL